MEKSSEHQLNQVIKLSLTNIICIFWGEAVDSS